MASLPSAQSQAPFAFGVRLLYGLRFARPPYTIHIDSLRQSLKIGRSRSLFASLSNLSISLRIGAKALS